MSEEKPAEQRRNAVLRPKKKHVVFCGQVLVGVAPVYDRKIKVSTLYRSNCSLKYPRPQLLNSIVK